MARFAFISDIHGNYAALEAVLDDIDHRNVDGILCLGDVVGYGPDPVACLERVCEVATFCVLGNHDKAVFDDLEAARFNANAKIAIEYTRDQLSDCHIDYLKSLSEFENLEDVSVSHASPITDAGSDYIHDQTIAARAYAGFTNACLFVGHTHVPLAFGTPDIGYAKVQPEDVRVALLPPGLPLRLAPSYRYILNPGSVGQPRDGNPDTAFGILDTDNHAFTIHRCPYDIDKTHFAIINAGLPDFLAHRLRIGA